MSSRIAVPLLRQVARSQASRRSSSRYLPSSSIAFLRPAATGASSATTVTGGRISTYSYSTTPTPLFASDNDDSHSDFAPQRKATPDDDDDAATQAMIHDHVTSNPIMLYMKGTPSMPMCGFSARVVGILQQEGVNFSSVNVLDYPSIREGVKQYAEWPTIPQLYIGGEFVGGCDIILSMAESGELSDMIKETVGEEGESK